LSAIVYGKFSIIQVDLLKEVSSHAVFHFKEFTVLVEDYWKVQNVTGRCNTFNKQFTCSNRCNTLNKQFTC